MNDDIENQGNTAAALEFAARVSAPETITFTHRDGREERVLITRDNGAARVQVARDIIAAHASAPERRKGTITVHDLASFIAATNRDKRPDSVIFADAPGRKVVAVLDFHGPADSAPRFGQDRISYGFQFSPQLLAWMKASESPMSQKDFSTLIDNRLGDIGDEAPAAGSVAAEFARRRGIKFATVADLVVFTRTISAKSTTGTEECIDEQTGDTKIQYTKKNDVKTPDGAPITPPAAFTLKIPILNGDKATEFTLAVRLRYDIGERGIAWRIELNALDVYMRAAIGEALDVVRKPAPDGCGLPVYLAAIPE